jgi:hypothetical protein
VSFSCIGLHDGIVTRSVGGVPADQSQAEQQHWDDVWTNKDPSEVSWFQESAEP